MSGSTNRHRANRSYESGKDVRTAGPNCGLILDVSIRGLSLQTHGRLSIFSDNHRADYFVNSRLYRGDPSHKHTWILAMQALKY